MGTRVSSLLRNTHFPHRLYFFSTRNLKRALELANVVADSRYKLFEDFMNEGGKTLAAYLAVVSWPVWKMVVLICLGSLLVVEV
jgi:hypothetical protein